jgi:hypothetical protein
LHDSGFFPIAHKKKKRELAESSVVIFLLILGFFFFLLGPHIALSSFLQCIAILPAINDTPGRKNPVAAISPATFRRVIALPPEFFKPEYPPRIAMTKLTTSKPQVIHMNQLKYSSASMVLL